uniref:Integrase catalytic domain-containing protein n=1 Tax=Trichuris muris TaxID=70415 RepID=A0A5S6R5Y0_TRIMR
MRCLPQTVEHPSETTIRMAPEGGSPLAVCVSDNGTNFVAGDRTLREGIRQLNDSAIEEFMAKKNIEWHFNPPGAPHFGGSWERLIGCAKRAITAILKGRSVHEEVFQTVVVEVEGLLNGRPLTHVSSDARDAEPLTPNDFLLGRPYASLPPNLLEDGKVISRRRWESSQILVNQFWRRWIREYLPSLASPRKGQSTKERIEKGDVVLIVEIGNPRGVWPMGKVSKTYPGPDGIVRVVDVQCSRGTRNPDEPAAAVEDVVS